jgi:hypothetical protein
MAGHHSPTGRGTKGYVALEIPDRGTRKAHLCFMKDYWRPLSHGTHTELQTYERLRECKVSYVATAIAGGNVRNSQDQEEFTVAEEQRQNEDGAPVKRQHYRVVTKEIGRPLETFHNFTEFLWCVYHVLSGMHSTLSRLPIILI